MIDNNAMVTKLCYVRKNVTQYEVVCYNSFRRMILFDKKKYELPIVKIHELWPIFICT